MFQNNNNAAGFGTIGIILIILCLIVAGLVGWRVWDASQTKNMTPVSTTNDPTKNTGTLQTDPNEGYVVIKEWGVRFKPVVGLEGVLYLKPTTTTIDRFDFSFSTNALVNVEPSCGQKGIVSVIRTKEPTSEFEKLLGQFNDYYYYFRGSDAACSTNASNFNLESGSRNMIKQSLNSLEPAK